MSRSSSLPGAWTRQARSRSVSDPTKSSPTGGSGQQGAAGAPSLAVGARFLAAIAHQHLLPVGGEAGGEQEDRLAGGGAVEQVGQRAAIGDGDPARPLGRLGVGIGGG